MPVAKKKTLTEWAKDIRVILAFVGINSLGALFTFATEIRDSTGKVITEIAKPHIQAIVDDTIDKEVMPNLMMFMEAMAKSDSTFAKNLRIVRNDELKKKCGDCRRLRLLKRKHKINKDDECARLLAQGACDEF